VCVCVWSGNWRKLAIWEEWRAATLVVVVFLMRVVPWCSLSSCAQFLMMITYVCVCDCPYISACLLLPLILVSTTTARVWNIQVGAIFKWVKLERKASWVKIDFCSVLLCFIKPILGNHYVWSRGFIVSEPRETHPRSEITDVPTLHCPPLDNLGCPDPHPAP